MFCPNCNSKNSTDQKFCRRCGLNLQEINQHLLKQLENSNIKRKPQAIERLGAVGTTGLLGMGVFGVLFLMYLVIFRFILSGSTESIVLGAMLLAFLIFASITLAYVILTEIKKEDKFKNNHFGSDFHTNLLEEKPFEPIISVTENTTELLFEKVKPRTSGELK
jgi:hypothetical protein